MGLDENKMPVGFHLMAKWWNEFEKGFKQKFRKNNFILFHNF